MTRIGMLALKVVFVDAEFAKQFLMANGLYDHRFRIARDSSHIYFPLIKRAKFPFKSQIVNIQLEESGGRKDWKELLLERHVLNKKDLGEFVKSYDAMGDIAVIEMPIELEKKEREIAKVLLETHSNLKVVAKKTTGVLGEFRVKGLKVIAGEKRLITIYRENGCNFKIDLSKVYFSPRLSFERDRIARQVKKGEKVLALFAGAGFYPIIIAKKQKKCEIVAIELNPVGVKYMEENIKLNKMAGRINALEGDVLPILKKAKFKRWATRAIMPLPHTGYEYLGKVIGACRKNAIIHFYYIPKDKADDAFKEAVGKVRQACNNSGRKFKVILKREVKTYAPHIPEVVIDFKLLS
jgi:tRNA (guanine37-N1)-methyltransferase